MMKEMYFDNILIADITEKTARFHKFEKGFNVITSQDNHVGKSSLLKSLYYTMGAEVEFDNVWSKNTKIYVVEFYVDKIKYRVARWQKAFALFSGTELILTTKSVSRDLAKEFEKIFSFAVYMANKKTNKIELAPPAFTFMPYYIDQDRGWSGLYESFSNIDQYKKPDRIKSLYYHLGIYTRSTVELMAKKDALKDKIEQLKVEEEKIRITIDSLYEETQNLVPADSIEELERLRFAWGEENFKFKLLQRLAEIYESDKNYNKALLTYQQSLNLAQTPSQKEDILNKMLKLFEDLYMNGRVDELQAVKAIALYKDYEWLAPRSRYYTAMAQKLADRMVAVDLLTSASDLLKEQLRLVNLSPDQKAQIGARLALIYLFEEDAIAALDILDKTQTKDLSQNQQQYRKIIKAKALAYLNKTDEALKLLEDDFSKNALLLKTDIYWKSGQWEKAANTIKYLIEKPQKDTPLTSEQRTYILDWIIALKKANRSTVIYRIRNTFLSYFEKTPYYSTFNILTSNLETNRVDMNSIDKAVNDISAYSNFSKIYDESLLKSLPQQPENKEAGEK